MLARRGLWAASWPDQEGSCLRDLHVSSCHISHQVRHVMSVRSWLMPAYAHIHLIGSCIACVIFQRIQSILSSLDVLLAVLFEL